MAKRYLLACGHADNATCNGKPFCAICGCDEIMRELDVDKNPSAGLEGRMCKCHDCGSIRPSAWTLPFFSYKPNEEFDQAYDGCYGWN